MIKRRFPIRKKSNKPLPKLKARLTHWFNRYIRIRDINPDGIGRCISCNKPTRYGENWHAGHFHPVSSTYSNLKYDEKNVNGQCKYCNSYLEGSTSKYRRGMISKYGEGVIEELDVKNKLGGTTRWYSFEYKAMIEVYKEKAKKEEKKLNFSLDMP